MTSYDNSTGLVTVDATQGAGVYEIYTTLEFETTTSEYLNNSSGASIALAINGVTDPETFPMTKSVPNVNEISFTAPSTLNEYTSVTFSGTINRIIQLNAGDTVGIKTFIDVPCVPPAVDPQLPFVSLTLKRIGDAP